MSVIAALALALSSTLAQADAAPAARLHGVPAVGFIRVATDPRTENLDRLIARIDREPTENILILATRLFESGRRDEGVFWYYVFQLRGRMEAETDSNAAQAYGAVFATLGPEFNEYAAADVGKLLSTMDRVLAWDDAHPLAGVDPKVRAKQRKGLAELRAYTAAHQDELRKGRTKNGLPNSGH